MSKPACHKISSHVKVIPSSQSVSSPNIDMRYIYDIELTQFIDC